MRLRLSVRSSMIAVMGVALLLGAGLAEVRRRSEYRERLDYHLQQLEGCPPTPGRSLFWELPRESQAHLIRSWMYHSMMYQKDDTALPIPLLRTSRSARSVTAGRMTGEAMGRCRAGLGRGRRARRGWCDERPPRIGSRRAPVARGGWESEIRPRPSRRVGGRRGRRPCPTPSGRAMTARGRRRRT